MQYLLWVIVSILLILIGLVLIRTLMFGKKFSVIPDEPIPAIQSERLANNLSAAVQCQTISYAEGTIPDGKTLKQLQQLLRKNYPLVHKHLSLEIVNEYGLLYTWQGSQPELKPVLFSAHQDVVPVDPATLKEWSKEPFGGEIADGFVWGRGTLDMKCQLVGVLDAVESLLAEGHTPARTVYLAFGHDEEVGGPQGAGHIAALLNTRGVHLAALWDEGINILEGALPGIPGPVGLVGVAEKGYLTVEFEVEGKPGHASTPPQQTAIGILAAALAKLEAHPLPADLGIIRNMMRSVATMLPFSLRMAFANLWLFGKVVENKLSAEEQTNAAIRTTTAVTVISGGVKDNILPHQATAKVNFRIYPGQTVEDVLTHIKKVIADERVHFQPVPLACWNPIAASPTDTSFYTHLQAAIQNTFNQVPVAPFMMVAATDSRHYAPICDAIYRFSPYTATSAELKRIHGIDERISLAALEKMLAFYIRLMRTWSSESENSNV